MDEGTAVYGWVNESQEWVAYFPDGVDIPAANDLAVLHQGQAYWIAIKGPGSVTWPIVV